MLRIEQIFDGIFYTFIVVASLAAVLGGSFFVADRLAPQDVRPSFEERHHVACIRANHSVAECELRLLEAIGK